jgi:hypothetical protein
MPGHYKSWTEAETTWRIKPSLSELGLFFVSEQPPGSAVQDAIDVDYAAAGYPPEVIARSRVVRENSTKLWIGPEGLTLGHSPAGEVLRPDDYLPDPMNWVRRVIEPKLPYGNWDIPKSGMTSDPASMTELHPFNNNGAAGMATFSRHALGFSLGLPRWTQTIGKPIPWLGPSGYMEEMVARVNELIPSIASDELVIAYTYGNGSATDGLEGDNPIYLYTYLHYAVFKKPYWMRGVDGLIFAGSGVGVNTDWGFLQYATGINAYNIGLRAVIATPGWIDFFDHASSRSSITSVATETSLTYDAGGSLINYVIYASPTSKVYESVDHVLGFTDPFNGGPNLAGVHCAEVYSCGGPEWMYQTTWLGKTAVDPLATSASLAVETRGGFYRWNASSLVTAGLVSDPADAEKLTGQSILTCYHPRAPKIKCDLEALELNTLCKDAGEDLSKKEYRPEISSDQPGLTFAEAAAKGSSLDASIFHLLTTLSADQTGETKILIKVTDGTPDAPIVRVFSVHTDGSEVMIGTAEAIRRIGEGWPFEIDPHMPVDPTANTAPEVARVPIDVVLFGESIGTILARAPGIVAGMAPFTEDKPWSLRLPDRARLSQDFLVGMTMQQSVMSRQGFSKFFILALYSGSAFRKVQC